MGDITRPETTEAIHISDRVLTDDQANKVVENYENALRATPTPQLPEKKPSRFQRFLSGLLRRQ